MQDQGQQIITHATLKCRTSDIFIDLYLYVCKHRAFEYNNYICFPTVVHSCRQKYSLLFVRVNMLWVYIVDRDKKSELYGRDGTYDICLSRYFGDPVFVG